MDIQFPKHKDHIRGIKLGQTSRISPAIEKTEMELGSVKKRVTHKKPPVFVSVAGYCTMIGMQWMNEFYLNEAQQGAAWFIWPCVRGYENSKMRFEGDIAFTEIAASNGGFYEFNIQVEVRDLPKAVDPDLIAEIDEHFGSTFKLYEAVNAMKGLNLKSEFETMRSFNHGNH